MVSFLISKRKEGTIHGDCNDYRNIMACTNYFVRSARMGFSNVCYDMWLSICISGYSIICINNVFNRNIEIKVDINRYQ